MYALNKEIERRTAVRAAAAHGALSHVMHVMCLLRLERKHASAKTTHS